MIAATTPDWAKSGRVPSGRRTKTAIEKASANRRYGRYGGSQGLTAAGPMRMRLESRARIERASVCVMGELVGSCAV